MGTNTAPYDLLVGAGRIYIAPMGTARPALTATPSGAWRDLGETDDGLKVNKTQNIETFSSDQRTGNVKAVRTEEGLTLEANLQSATLENLADVINGVVTDTAQGVGTIGIRSTPLHAGATVAEYAFLFRAYSPYGAYNAQYWLPRGFFNDDVETEYKKDDKSLIPVKFEALEYASAATEAERFGIYEAQDAAAL
jgi:hypothetical protein